MSSNQSNESPGALSVYRFGTGVGVTGMVFYLGCILTMATVPRETAVTFFNSLLHGLNVDPVLRDGVPFWEALMGVVSTFILGWVAGMIIACVYNCCRKSEPAKTSS